MQPKLVNTASPELTIKLKAQLVQWLQPKNIASNLCKIPLFVNQSLFEFALNQVFKQEIIEGDFDFLEGRLLQVQIEDADLWFAISFKNNQLKIKHFSQSAVQADASLCLNTADAILLIEQQIDPDTLFFQRRLKISGDTQMAHQAKNTIDRLDPKKIPKALIKLFSHYRQKLLETN